MPPRSDTPAEVQGWIVDLLNYNEESDNCFTIRLSALSRGLHTKFPKGTVFAIIGRIVYGDVRQPWNAFRGYCNSRTDGGRIYVSSISPKDWRRLVPKLEVVAVSFILPDGKHGSF